MIPVLKTTLATNWDLQVPLSIIFAPIELKANCKRLIMHKPVKPMMMGWVGTLTGSMSKRRVILTLWEKGDTGKIAEKALWMMGVSFKHESHGGKEETGSLSDLVSRERREHERRKTYGNHRSAWVCLWSASDEQSGRNWWEKMGQRDSYTILDVSVKLWRV